jgi:hypothetical protein
VIKKYSTGIFSFVIKKAIITGVIFLGLGQILVIEAKAFTNSLTIGGEAETNYQADFLMQAGR